MGFVKETVYTNKNKFGNPLTYEEKKAIFAVDDELDAVVENTADWYIKTFLEIGKKASTYTIRLNPDNRRGFDICMLTYECKLEGLNIPQGTRFLRTINTVDPEWQLVKRMVLREFLDDYSSDPKKAEKIADLFSPAFGFKKQDPMQTAIMTLAKDYVQSKLNGGSTFSLQNHKFKPEHFANNEPIESFIPPLEWFPESLKQVKFEDIFSIVSTKPELEVLKLFFGRVAIGASKYETHGETISSDFRTIALVQSSAGCGKSKFVDYLSSAMSKIGLSVEAMQDPAARFNQAPALLANLSVSDDSGEKKMIAFSQSPLIKSCATGSPIRVEEKGVDARTIVPNAAILAFLNDIPLKILRSSDTGNADRLALIKADSQNRLRDTRNVSELLRGVESRIIPATTNWICNKLDISTDLLYAYMLRLCLDYFCKFYDEKNKAYLVNNHIRKQKQYFKLAINSEYRQAYFNFILLAD
ncbi:MAG: primase-helicase family protein, partial [Waterburya sp.]